MKQLSGSAKAHQSIRTVARIAAICIASVIFATGCAQKKAEKAESIADIQAREGIPVRTVNVKAGELQSIEILGGTAEGLFQTTVNSGAAGRITAIKVQVGSYVEKDASLMTIEPDAAQTFELAKQQFDNAEKSRERIKTLAAQGGVSQEVVDQTEIGYLSAKKALDASKKAEYVQAPFAGTVTNIYPSLNTTVDKGKSLVDLARLDRIKITMSVSEAIINRFRIGQVALAIVGNDTVQGAISSVALSGQASSHNFSVEAQFDNPKRILKPGMYASVKVIVEKKMNVISLSIEIIQSDGANNYVYIVRDGLAKKSPITTGIRGGSVFEVLSGLALGDGVVSDGASLLSDGAKVKVVQ